MTHERSANNTTSPANSLATSLAATFFAAAITLTATTASIAALAEDSLDRMTWQYYQFNDDANRGRTTSQISVGIPETDNRIMEARCSAGSSGAFSYLTLAAPVATLRENDPIDITFKASNFSEKLSGMVSGVEAGEEALVGVRLLMENDSPVWDKFSALPAITYSVAGSEMTRPMKPRWHSLIPIRKRPTSPHPMPAKAQPAGISTLANRMKPWRFFMASKETTS